jgi:hypothetical protein
MFTYKRTLSYLQASTARAIAYNVVNKQGYSTQSAVISNRYREHRYINVTSQSHYTLVLLNSLSVHVRCDRTATTVLSK